MTKTLKSAALCACLLAVTTAAHAGQHWAYCTVHNDSEVWVSPVMLETAGMDPIKADFIRLLTDQYPTLRPRVYNSIACYGEDPELSAFDQAQMQQYRNREMKQFSSVHEIRMGPDKPVKTKGFR